MSAAAVLLTAAALAVPAQHDPGHDAGSGTGTGTGTAGSATTVSMPGKYFAPAHLTVLVGDTVTWRNDDAAAHSVRADDGSFSSPSLGAGASWQQTFARQGSYPYYCTVHRQMRGTLEVASLGLTAPGAPVTPGGHATLDVVAPAGTDQVTLERLTATGADAVATTTPRPDGRGTFHVAVDAPGRYRARAGERLSTVVGVAVAPRVTATATRRGRRVTVRATISPALPGARVELQRYVRERFDYLPLRRGRSADGTTATFRFRTGARAALRVAVVEAPGGWSPGRSRNVVVQALRSR